MNHSNYLDRARMRATLLSGDELFQFYHGAPLEIEHPPSPEDVPTREDGTPGEHHPESPSGDGGGGVESRHASDVTGGRRFDPVLRETVGSHPDRITDVKAGSQSRSSARPALKDYGVQTQLEIGNLILGVE